MGLILDEYPFAEKISTGLPDIILPVAKRELLDKSNRLQ